MTTKDEALRVAREALENILGVEVMAPEGGREEVTEIHGIARSALRTIALAVEGPTCKCGQPWILNTVHRTNSPCWRAPDPVDGLAAPAVQSVALGDPKSAFEAAMREKHPEWSFTPDPVFGYHNERTRLAWEGWQAASASGAVGETAGTNASQLIDELEWAVLARSQGVPGSADRLHDAKQAIRDALAGVPATSNDQQENGNA